MTFMTTTLMMMTTTMTTTMMTTTMTTTMMMTTSACPSGTLLCWSWIELLKLSGICVMLLPPLGNGRFHLPYHRHTQANNPTVSTSVPGIATITRTSLKNTHTWHFRKPVVSKRRFRATMLPDNTSAFSSTASSPTVTLETTSMISPAVLRLMMMEDSWACMLLRTMSLVKPRVMSRSWPMWRMSSTGSQIDTIEELHRGNRGKGVAGHQHLELAYFTWLYITSDTSSFSTLTGLFDAVKNIVHFCKGFGGVHWSWRRERGFISFRLSLDLVVLWKASCIFTRGFVMRTEAGDASRKAYWWYVHFLFRSKPFERARWPCHHIPALSLSTQSSCSIVQYFYFVFHLLQDIIGMILRV